VAAFFTAALQYLASVFAVLALAETMLLFAFFVAWLVRTFHAVTFL
jgi:F0F1-type ATP synthase membrane subunit c/vacuolar-type H+-ATPase subunit K